MNKIRGIKILNHLKQYPKQFIKNIFFLHISHLKFKKMYKKYDGKIVYLPYPPKNVTIAICGYCMNACEFCASHCIDSGRNKYSNHQFNIPYFMSYSDFCKIVDMCYEARVPHVHIVAAGEPFLNKDVFKMMDYLSQKYGIITIQTNFDKKLFQTKNIVQELIKRKFFIQRITTDIFPPDIHNNIKKGSDYNFVLDTIEYLSKKTDILFDIHTILTKKSFKNLDKLVFDLYTRKIKFVYNVVNLHPHNFNVFTSSKNVYISDDKNIQKELLKLKNLGNKLGLDINLPHPWDNAWEVEEGKCLSFWSRFQVVPDKNLPKERWIGNIIPSQCNAVVIGQLFSLGNLFDYDNLMDFWNNKKFLKIRENLIKGIYPDERCATCYKYVELLNNKLIKS